MNLRRILQTALVAGVLTSLGAPAYAQQTADTAAPPAQLTADQQIAAAVLPAPEAMRAGATVLGYGDDGRLKKLRQGSGELICLASDPKAERFHVACYHRSLEPFMARGRALRARGITGDKVDSVRFAEVREGKLRMPRHPAALYSLTGPAGSFDPATGTMVEGEPLYVVYVPFATGKSLGLATEPVEGAPWIMHPGTPKAHIMFQPGM
jgi:hypothetical protein